MHDFRPGGDRNRIQLGAFPLGIDFLHTARWIGGLIVRYSISSQFGSGSIWRGIVGVGVIIAVSGSGVFGKNVVRTTRRRTGIVTTEYVITRSTVHAQI